MHVLNILNNHIIYKQANVNNNYYSYISYYLMKSNLQQFSGKFC
jgi:hypothetical protein